MPREFTAERRVYYSQLLTSSMVTELDIYACMNEMLGNQLEVDVLLPSAHARERTNPILRCTVHHKDMIAPIVNYLLLTYSISRFKLRSRYSSWVRKSSVDSCQRSYLHFFYSLKSLVITTPILLGLHDALKNDCLSFLQGKKDAVMYLTSLMGSLSLLCDQEWRDGRHWIDHYITEVDCQDEDEREQSALSASADESTELEGELDSATRARIRFFSGVDLPGPPVRALGPIDPVSEVPLSQGGGSPDRISPTRAPNARVFV